LADINERERDTMPIHSKYGKAVKTKLERISRRARANKENVFNNIGHVIDMELLQEKYRQLDGSKAVGIMFPKLAETG
jgi:RNA-directed DNA polymerase